MADDSPKLFIATVIAPITRAPIRDGGILVRDGIIVAAGRLDDLRADHSPDLNRAELIDAGDSILTPGLVNSHTHLELSGLSHHELKSTTFGDWILQLGAAVRSQRASTPNAIEQAVAEGVRQCIRFGVTAVGDISQQASATRKALRSAPLTVVSFGEALGLGAVRDRFQSLLQNAVDSTYASARLRIGISPHAPYTVDRAGFQQCVEIAKTRGLPIATHVAEHPDEEQFLRELTGMFRDVWERTGTWGGDVPTFDGSPVEFAAAVGLLSQHALLAHVNYCDARDLAVLARGNASVVWCPRTHQYFGHPPHRFREMLAAGINVAIGTDSCASSHDLNLLADAQLVLKRDPGVDTHTLWRMMTINGARALRLDSSHGSLEPGKNADFVAFPVAASDGSSPDAILRTVVAECRTPRHVWVEGMPVEAPAES